MQVKTIPLDVEAADNALLVNAIYTEIERQGSVPHVYLLWRVLRILSPYWMFWR